MKKATVLSIILFSIILTFSCSDDSPELSPPYCTFDIYENGQRIASPVLKYLTNYAGIVDTKSGTREIVNSHYFEESFPVDSSYDTGVESSYAILITPIFATNGWVEVYDRLATEVLDLSLIGLVLRNKGIGYSIDNGNISIEKTTNNSTKNSYTGRFNFTAQSEDGKNYEIRNGKFMIEL
jgi:hypothetical protein